MHVHASYVCPSCGHTVSSLSYRATCPDCGDGLERTAADRR